METFNDEGLSSQAKSDSKLKMKSSPGIYVSFWPKHICGNDCKQGINLDRLHEGQDDINVEKHPAEDSNFGAVYDLSGLDIASINKLFEEFQNTGSKNWSIFGRSSSP